MQKVYKINMKKRWLRDKKKYWMETEVQDFPVTCWISTNQRRKESRSVKIQYCSMKPLTDWAFFWSFPFWSFTSVLIYCSSSLTSLLYNNHYTLQSVPFTEWYPSATHLSYVKLRKCPHSRSEHFISQTLSWLTKGRVYQFHCTVLYHF